MGTTAYNGLTPVSPKSQIFEFKTDIDSMPVSRFHLSGAVALLIGFVVVVGCINHRANR